jgi:hypothetical protein
MSNKKISRSSKTGKFVTAKYAAKHKATTESEKITVGESVLKFLVIGDPGHRQVDLVLMYWDDKEKSLFKAHESGRVNDGLPTVFDTRQQARKSIRATRKYIRANKLSWKGNYVVIPIKVNI